MSLQFDRQRYLHSWEISYTELSLSERIAAVVDHRIVAAAWAHLALVSQPWHCHPGLATAELRSFGLADPTPSFCSIPCPPRESWREGIGSRSIGTSRKVAIWLRRQPLEHQFTRILGHRSNGRSRIDWKWAYRSSSHIAIFYSRSRSRSR